MATINMRDFPDDLHRALKVWAAECGTSVKALMIRFCKAGLQDEWPRSWERFVEEKPVEGSSKKRKKRSSGGKS